MAYKSDSSSPDCNVESKISAPLRNDEPFDTFQARVLTFAQNNLWPDAEGGDVTIELLSDGRHKRIIALTRRKEEGRDDSADNARDILQVPRSNTVQVDYSVAVLRFLERYPAIPVPRVIGFDGTSVNRLGFPYMLQNRVDGVELKSIFPKLSRQDKIRVTRDLANIYRQMIRIKSSAPGYVKIRPENENGRKEPFEVTPFGSNTPQTAFPHMNRTTSRIRPLTNFATLITNELAHYIGRDEPEIAKFLCEEVSRIDARGAFDAPNCLAHLDLGPHNILVNPTTELLQPIISSVLGHDNFAFVPAFMACTPPNWIWRKPEEGIGNRLPYGYSNLKGEAKQLKLLFEETAGPDYKEYSGLWYELPREFIRLAFGRRVPLNEKIKEIKELALMCRPLS